MPSSRGLVVVLSPDVQDEVTRNAMARIVGELAAAPFQVVMQPVDPDVELMVQVETAGRDLAPVAAFAIVRETNGREASGRPSSVAVWVSNRITQTTTVHRVRVRGGDVDGAAAHLAIEAVELVRASLPGLWPRAPGAGAPGTPTAETVTPPAPPPAPPPTPRLQMGIGVGLFLDTAPTLWAPTLAASYGRPAGLGVRLDLVGLGPGADVSASDGTGARLQRAAASLGLVRAFRPDRRIRPVVSIGGGAQYLGAQGTGAPADRERSLRAWSAMLAAGAGVTVALGPHVALLAEAKALLTWPSVVVRVGDTDVAHFDRLSTFLNVGLLATF